MKEFRILKRIIIGVALLAFIALTVVPASSDENESIRKTPDGLTVPDLIYFGGQFRGPGLYRMQYLCGSAHVGN